jgi:Subtilase family
MTESGEWRENLVPRVLDETELIVRAFADADERHRRTIAVVTADDRGIDFMYAQGEILVREAYLEQVLQILERRARVEVEQDQPPRIQPVIEGVVLLRLPAEYSDRALAALELIDDQLRPGIATPNHVLTVAGEASGCSATEPEAVYYEDDPFPSVCPNGGAGVLVFMADTGLLLDAATHPWLAYGVGMLDPAQDVDPLQGGPPEIQACTGHGTFGAGVLRCMAPDARIIMTRALLYGGSQVESDLVPVLESALGLGADIFHLTIACLSRNDQPLIGFDVWLEHLHSRPGAICLAPAGNNGFDRPEWPAAFPEVIAVGALGRDWRHLATFSNFGPWVDVYAPGTDIINAFATGEYRCYVDPYAGDIRKFYGMARWSGTSFSTPIVSGLIAARMSRTGETARQAAAALLAEARAQAIPDIGPVLLPRCHDDDEPRHPEDGCCCGHRHRHRHRHDCC